MSQKRNLETSLGYFINPLLNMALGGVLFRERINRVGLVRHRPGGGRAW